MSSFRRPRSAEIVSLARRQLGLALLTGAAGALLPARSAWSQAGAARTAPAAASLYTLEMIVFRNSGSAAGEDTTAASNELLQDSDTGGNDGARSARFGELLPATRRRMSDVAARLNAAGGHKVIGHVVWTQTASAWNTGSSISVEQLGLNGTGLTGVVRLERGSYLHLGFNLVFAPTATTRYTLAQIRRIKLNERQYFDHPALGIIAQVAPRGSEEPDL